MIEVSAMCREHGIAETLCYAWRDRLFEGGKGVRAGRCREWAGLGRQETCAHGRMRLVALSIRQ